MKKLHLLYFKYFLLFLLILVIYNFFFIKEGEQNKKLPKPPFKNPPFKNPPSKKPPPKTPPQPIVFPPNTNLPTTEGSQIIKDGNYYIFCNNKYLTINDDGLVLLENECTTDCSWNIKTHSLTDDPNEQIINVKNVTTNTKLRFKEKSDIKLNNTNLKVLYSDNSFMYSYPPFDLVKLNDNSKIVIPTEYVSQYKIDKKPILYVYNTTYNNKNISIIVDTSNNNVNTDIAYFTVSPV